MFKLMYKDRKGVSLAELLVAVAILGLIIPLVMGLFTNIVKLNNSTVDKWDVQTATRMACRDFESNTDGLTNAYQVDLLYDPVIEGGVTLSYGANGECLLTWRTGDPTSKTMHAEGISVDSQEHKTNIYTYVFSAKTYLEDGTYLGELLYQRDYNETRSHLLLKDVGLGEVPVSVTFSMGTTENLIDKENATGDGNASQEGTKYTKSSVIVHFSSGKEDINYNYDTSFAIINITRNINYVDGKLVCELKWLGTDAKTPLAYPAGWDNYYINTKEVLAEPSTNVDGTEITTSEPQYIDVYADGRNFPKSSSNVGFSYTTNYKCSDGTNAEIAGTFDMDVYDDDGNYVKTVQAPKIARQANVLRYKSPAAEKSQGATDSKSTNTNIATCLTSFAMMGSDMKDEVLGNLRLFRDCVLRGTEFGDWFIHQYYYVWSPFLIEHTAFLKPVYQAILIPVSYVCEFIAKL